MRVVFLGTPTLAIPALDTLVESQHEVLAVLTRPDKPAGRSRVPGPPPIKGRALDLGLPVWQPPKAREAIDEIHDARADVLAVVAYGGWLPPPVLEATEQGCVNVHPSLLPRWRGAAPIERAIIAGDETTGVSTMQIDEGLDTGPLYLQQECPVGRTETAGELAARLAELGADLLVRTLDGLEDGSLTATPQSEEGVTYAEKLTPDECEVDWAAPAEVVDGLIRGSNPRPGAWTMLGGRRIKLWRSRLASSAVSVPGGTPGEVLSTAPLVVSCASGAVELLEVQPDGKARMSAEAFCRGHDVGGERMGAR